MMDVTDDNLHNVTSSHQMAPLEIYRYPAGFTQTLGSVLIMENMVGFLFNITVLLVHWLKKEPTPTVSSLILINLNIVDLLVCVFTIPMTIARVFTGFEQTPMFCVFHEASVSMATTSTALGLMIVSIDRYQTIVTPFKSRLNRTNMPFVFTVVWGIVAIGFLFPIIALLPTSHADGLAELTNDNSTTISCFLWVHFNSARALYELYYVVVYVVANVTMIGCYIGIYVSAKRRINTRISIIRAAMMNLPGVPQINITTQKLHERTITKMTLMIVLTYVICWAPHVILSIVMVTMDTQYLELVQVVCLSLAYTGTLLHPLLYAFMQKKFRDVFNKKIIQKSLGRAQSVTHFEKEKKFDRRQVRSSNEENKATTCYKESQPCQESVCYKDSKADCCSQLTNTTPNTNYILVGTKMKVDSQQEMEEH